MSGFNPGLVLGLSNHPGFDIGWDGDFCFSIVSRRPAGLFSIG